MAEIDDFDLDQSVTSAWSEFEARLADVLSVIDDSADLSIGADAAASGDTPHAEDTPHSDDAPYLVFSSPVRHVVRGTAAAHRPYGTGTSLAGDQAADLIALGWCPDVAEGPTPASPSPAYHLEVPQEHSEQLAAIAGSTLRGVYGVPHPVFLRPSELAEVLQPRAAPLESVEAPRTVAAVVPSSREQLDELLEADLTALHGHPPIRDAEGDIAIRVGSTMVFLRTPADGQEIVLFSAVVHDLSGRSRAAEVLNDLNVEARWVKFQLVRDRVFVTLSILARPFVALHLRQALRIISGVADGIDEELAVKLGGRTTFADRDGRS